LTKRRPDLKIVSGIRTNVYLLVSLFITMEVIQSIRKLLFLEDCLIIPGLGGFVSKYRPAVIDKVTGTFIPPSKEIAFNSELLQNDGVLVNYFANQSGISIELARQEVDRFVSEAKIKLEHDDPVFIEGIGQLTRDKNREVRFQADPGINLFPDSFGLVSFHLSEVLLENHSNLNNPLIFKREEPSRTVDFPADSINKPGGGRNFRRVAIALPLLIAFSLLPFNSRVTDILISSRASLAPEPSLFRLNYPDPVQKDTAKLIVFPISENRFGGSLAVDTVKQEDVRKVEVKGEEVRKVSGRFPVIAGCFKVRSNADRLHKQLVDKGYPSSITTSKNGFFKVCVESFTTRTDAISGLARLKSAEPGLELWVAL
jgi:hypothetical protein